MSSFTEALIIQKLGDSKSFKVYVPFDYHVGGKYSDEVIHIPEDFVTDLASIPMIVRGIIPRIGKHCQAAVVHDFICKYNLYSRKRCDEIFLEAMEVLGVPAWKRKAMFYAVRMFGWISWKDNVEENKKDIKEDNPNSQD